MRTAIFACLALIVLSSFTFKSVTLSKTFESNNADVNFRIQLCEYQTIVPVKTVELLREIGATPIKSNFGSVYVTKPYNSELEATDDLPKFRALGFEDAATVVQMGNDLLSVDHYHDLQEKDGSKDTKHRVVRVWK